MTEIAQQYYRLALSKAARRDLSGAAQFARYACQFDASHENAAILLDICRQESGDFDAGDNDDIKKILISAERKEWRRAARMAKSIPNRSVRMLNIQGCIYACAKRYGKAARFFAEALEKDHGNQLSAAGLAEVMNKRHQKKEDENKKQELIW